MHIHIHFQKTSIILFSLKLLISISVFLHREQFRELLPYSERSTVSVPSWSLLLNVTVGELVKTRRSLLPPGTGFARAAPGCAKARAEARPPACRYLSHRLPDDQCSRPRPLAASAVLPPLHRNDSYHRELPQRL